MFPFTLPEDRIARYPTPTRSHSRLLQVRKHQPNTLSDLRFDALPDILSGGDLLVMNNSKVIPARLYLHKTTGAKVELLLERVLDTHTAQVLCKSNKPLAPGTMLDHIPSGTTICIGAKVAHAMRLATLTNNHALDWLTLLQQYGEVPLPPYMNRAPESLDKERYQTIYANEFGSVAAPTAGLHFDTAVLNALRAKGVETTEVTLHVGYGTFAKPDPSATTLHSERYSVSACAAAALRRAKAAGRSIYAVGTTSARVVESLAATHPHSSDWDACDKETTLCIKPGFSFRVIEGLITNFHLPESSLLWLVCALAGTDTIRQAYTHALANDYRFYSYGDAMLIS